MHAQMAADIFLFEWEDQSADPDASRRLPSPAPTNEPHRMCPPSPGLELQRSNIHSSQTRRSSITNVSNISYSPWGERDGAQSRGSMLPSRGSLGSTMVAEEGPTRANRSKNTQLGPLTMDPRVVHPSQHQLAHRPTHTSASNSSHRAEQRANLSGKTGGGSLSRGTMAAKTGRHAGSSKSHRSTAMTQQIRIGPAKGDGVATGVMGSTGVMGKKEVKTAAHGAQAMPVARKGSDADQTGLKPWGDTNY